MATLDLSTLTVVGPFWTAEVDVITLSAPERALALRRLFIDITPRSVADVDNVLAPGTLIALCVAQRVRVQPANGSEATYEWRRRDGASLPPLATYDQLRQAVRAGSVSLLLFAADPATWVDDNDNDNDNDDPPPMTCLAGDIGLDALQPLANATTRLYAALHLQQPATTSVRSPGALSVHASGLSILGSVQLPWLPLANQQVSALFQLARVLAAPDTAAPAFRLTIEAQRLTDDEHLALIAAAQRLSQTINPRYPLNVSPLPGAQVPQWFTLELVNPTQPPRLFWPLPSWGTLGRLSFERGEVNLLLSDREPYSLVAPPSSLARLLPSEVAIEPTAAGALGITVRVGTLPAVPPNTPRPDAATYSYTAGATGAETLRLAEIVTAFSPVETPTFLRTAQGLDVPAWSNDGDKSLVESVVWGFTPLEDGWAQLPIPNLSEQIYIDAQVAQLDAVHAGDGPQAAFVQGAVSFSGRASDGTPADIREHPWSVTLTDALALDGTWTLTNVADSYTLDQIRVTIAQPDIALNGFFWLSNGQPTPEDALPDFDNWVAGLRNVPLRRVHTRAEGAQIVAADLFPALLVLRLEALVLHAPRSNLAAAAGAAQLASWSLVLEAANPRLAFTRPGATPDAPPIVTFTTLAERLFGGAPSEQIPPLLPTNMFTRYEALLWRRHPSLPAVQALPLTQSKEPPNAPSASRQLVPFALSLRPPQAPLPAVPGGWRFSVAVAPGQATNGAATWPRLEGATQPASEWRSLPDLPLAVLSLPGLALDPSAHAASSGLPPDMLPLIYRYDLPYSDEVQALAQLPKVPRKPGEVSPLPDDPPLAPLRPLLRDTYAAHWQRLSERASLAAADAVEATNAENDQTSVQHLVEPFVWPVTPSVALNAYPGELRLSELGAAPESALVLRGGDAAPDAAGSASPGLSDAALRGISGRFAVRSPNQIARATAADAAPFVVHAGSLEAYRNADGSFRDQRGLSRFASAEVGQLVTTGLRLDSETSADRIELTSTRMPWSLEIAGGQRWQIWFRDLPVRAGSFLRSAAISPLAQDVNDPEATAREYSYRNGYEWRLAEAISLPGEAQALRLCGLEFYPLTLERLDVAAALVQRVELIGRLQLPLAQTPNEIAALSNAVRVTFALQHGALTLIAVELEPAAGPQAVFGEWPLALNNHELGDAPRIVWKNVIYDPVGALTLTDAELCFQLFDVAWRVPIAANTARFTSTAPVVAPQLTIPAVTAPLATAAMELVLHLNAAADAVGTDELPAPVVHRVTLDLALRLGRALAAPADTAASRRTAFTATLRYTLLAPDPAPPIVIDAALFDEIELQSVQAPNATLELSAVGRTLQFAWERPTQVPPVIDLLPGMTLVGAVAPGCAALTFSATYTDAVPQLDLRLAFVEAALQASWGDFLQHDTPPADATPQQVYGSSAGDLTFGYTAQAVRTGDAISWDEGFLLNGFIEVRSLISWPAAMQFNRTNSSLTLPSALVDGTIAPLSHTRHTMRVLLNQHQIPPALLVLSAQPALLFDLAPAVPWQLLAVVEHQLIDVLEAAQADGTPTLRLAHDRRWTAAQELRLMSPAALRSFLQTYGDPALRTVDPVAGLAPLTEGGEGYFAPAVRTQLLAALAARPALGPCMLVEASAPHWLRTNPLNKDLRATALQYLPGGSQHAILSGPDDFTPSAPRSPESEWLLLTMPFLGRLQPASADGIDATAPGADAGPLAVDPILALRRALSLNPLPAHTALALSFTHRGAQAGVAVRVADLDTAAGRTWSRLDPLTLDENWYRLQTPFPEPQPAYLPSVIAALPDTPARASRSIALRRAFDTFRPFVPPADLDAFRQPADPAWRYELPPETIEAQLVWRERSLLAHDSRAAAHTAPGQRVTNGLQVLYTISEGGGTTLVDVSGVGTALNLRITEPGDVDWLPGGGLKLNAPTLFRSDVPATKLINACRASNEITLEAWVRCESATQNGPARIITLSKNDAQRNITLEQGQQSGDKALFNARLRTSQTNVNGLPSLNSPLGSATTNVIHLVFTRAANGTARIYIDGVEQPHGPSSSTTHTGTVAGTFTNWDTTFEFGLANELTRSRGWRGEFYLVAVYSRALSAVEVLQNFHARGTSASTAWHTTGALLASSGMAGEQPSDAPALRRYPAATLLPVRFTRTFDLKRVPTTVANAQPLGFAVSPYLGLSFHRAPAVTTQVLIAAELVGIDPLTGRLLPAAMRVFEIGTAPKAGGDRLREQMLGWAHEQHRQLIPESPVALVRLREIAARPEAAPTASNAEESTIVTSFRFALVGELDLPRQFAQRVARLRAPVAQLRFREGQYGGRQLPVAPEAFELAPPQVTGAQPIYLTERPNAPQPSSPPPPEQPPQPAVTWPWGVSALRFSLKYTAAGRGVVGIYARDQGSGVSGQPDHRSPITDHRSPTLWWQAIQHGVQYRSALRTTPLFTLAPGLEAALQENGLVKPALHAAFDAHQLPLDAGSMLKACVPGSYWHIIDTINHVRYTLRKQDASLRVFRNAPAAAGLPALFRAAPIRSLLPVLSDPQLPRPLMADPQQPPISVAELLAGDIGQPGSTWQPVLPGRLHYLLVGARSGVLLAVRNQLIRQRDDDRAALVSGSVPVQHRVPRPVPLPPNRVGSEVFALRTWPSYFAPEANVLVSAQPVDEAFYADTLTQPPRRLRLRLLNLPRGTIPAQWNGLLLFEQHSEAGLTAGGGLNPATMLAAGENIAYTAIGSAPLFTITNISSQEASTTTPKPTREQIRVALAAFGITLSKADDDVTFAPLVETPANADVEVWHLSDPKTDIDLQISRPFSARADSWEVRTLNTRLCAFMPSNDQHLRRQIAALGVGASAIAQVTVKPIDDDGFEQTLSFALRLGDATAPPLPLDPYTIHFEDPEYNRALATQAGLAQRMIKLPKKPAPPSTPPTPTPPQEFGLVTVSLTTDRRAYNTYSSLALRYDWDDKRLDATLLRVIFTRLTTDGATDELMLLTNGTQRTLHPKPGDLVQIALSDLRVKRKISTQPNGEQLLGNDLALHPDDRLQITLVLDDPALGIWSPYEVPTTKTLPIVAELAVDIVAEPVIPAPEVAYGLLRRQLLNGSDEVECTRFAWGPDASRIELVSKDDLVVGVVRRRAVFQWRDVVRRGTLHGYAIQKIAQNGATHIPTEWVLP